MSATTSASAVGFDPEQFIPVPHPLVRLHDRGAQASARRYVLLRDDGGAPVMLDDDDLRIWELIDGERTVTDLCRLYLERHRKLALTRVYSVVQKLAAAGIIAPPPALTSARSASPIWLRMRLANRLLFNIPGSAALLKIGAGAVSILKFDHLPIHILLWLIATAGAVAAMIPGTHTDAAPFILSRAIETPVGMLPAGSVAGILLLLAANFALSFLREWWRGSVERSFSPLSTGIRVVMHYGLPAFQADNRYRCILPLRQRIATAFAGVELELALAGAASVALHFCTPAAAEFLDKLVWLLYLRCLMHAAPVDAADLAPAFGVIGDVPKFRNRALGFLRHNLFDALFGDSELNREQRLYVAWNTFAIGWLLLIFVGGSELAGPVGQLIGDLGGESGSGDQLIAVILIAVIGIPFAACITLAILSILYLFLSWLVNSPAFRQPTISAAFSIAACTAYLAAVSICAKLGLLAQSTRDFLLGLGALAILLTSAALIRKVPGALMGGRQATRLYVTQWVTAALILQVALAILAPSLLAIASWLTLAALACWILWTFVSGLSAFSLMGGRLMITELTALLGAGIAIAACLAAANLMNAQADSLVALFAGVALFSVGSAAAARGSANWQPATTTMLPVSAPETSRTTIVQELGSHVIRAAAAEIRSAFGNTCCKRVAAAAGASTPLNLENPAEHLGNNPKSYTDSLAAIGEAIAKRFGRQAANLVITRALDSVHWRGRLVLHNQILPGTPWQNHFADEAAIREGERNTRLEKILLFQDLAANQRQEIADRLVAQRIDTGEALVRQGDPARHCFLIVEGDVQVEEQDAGGEIHVLSYLTDGDFFGESALLEESTRTATVRALTSTLVLRWAKSDFDELSSQSPDTAKRLVRQLRYMRVLLQIPLFADLPKDALRNLLPRLRSKKTLAGDEIVRQGETGTQFFLIQSGTVEVVKHAQDQDIVLCELGKGDYFGEIALLQDQPRTATVRAVTDAALLVLEKSDFLRLTTASDLFATNLSTISKDRLKAH